MTMQYDNGGDAAGLESGPSADAAGLQSGDQAAGAEQSLEGRLAALIDQRLTPLDRRIQSFTDRTANSIGALERTVAALREEFGNTPAIQDLADKVGDLHEATIDEAERKVKNAERQAARLAKQVQQPPARQPQQAQMTREEAETRYNAEIAPDLEAYATLRGFTPQEIATADWDARLLAAGAPQELDLSPQGIRTYKERMRAALDRMAQQKRAETRGRTVMPNPGTSGSGRRDYRNIQSVREIPDAEFESNFADIAAAVVAKNRR